MFTSAYARLVAGFDMVIAVVAGHLRARHAGLQSATAGYRAVTFIEYALLAAIAVAIAAIFRKQLGEVFTTLLAKFSSAATDTTGTK